MNKGNPNRYAEQIIFWGCLVLTFLFYSQALYNFAYDRGVAVPKRCASVEGKEVVSTTAEVCTYAQSYGRATVKRRAM